MRSRIIWVAAAVSTAAVITTVVVLLATSGSGDGPEAAPTPASTTTVPSTTTSTTSTSTTTTTTTLPPDPVTLDADGSGALRQELLAFYTWLVDREAEQPVLPGPLVDHVAGVPAAEPGAVLELSATIHRDRLADGSRVAVVVVDDDLILAVDEGEGWRVVGARLTRFGLDPWYGDPVRHVLLIGTDARHRREDPPQLRADSIHIVSASLDDGGGAIVGFPRDSYVEASYGNDKFSSVNARSGTDEMVDIAERLSGVDVEGYVLTGFLGFRKLINGFGGVEVDVPFRMSDEDSEAYLEPGPQVLNGGPALAFSRNRHIPGGDFTRSFHQGVVIQAVVSGSQSMGVERLPGLLALLSEHTWTDLSARRLLQLGAIVFEIDPGAVGNVVLPGAVGTAGGASVVRLTSGAEAVFEDLADGVILPAD